MDQRRKVKTRVKTGCLTCRARRIKCDQGRPECHRCRSSNVECLGYPQRRSVTRGRSPSSGVINLQRSAAARGPTDDKEEASPSSSSALHRSDSLPLIGLPPNPLPNQRPHHGARQILTCHHFMCRTASVISTPPHHHFWRDHLCTVAWGSEFVYDAIIALGAVHRAVILMDGSGQTDLIRGQETTVVAAQAYTQALEKLDHFLRDNQPDGITVAVILLLALFEVCGNSCAFTRLWVTNRMNSASRATFSRPTFMFRSQTAISCRCRLKSTILLHSPSRAV